MNLDIFTKLAISGHSQILSDILNKLDLPEILILTSTSNQIRNIIYKKHNFKNIPILNTQCKQAAVNRDLVWKPKNRDNIDDYDLMINPNLLSDIEKLEDDYQKFLEDHENLNKPLHRFKIGQCVKMNILKNQYREYEGCVEIKGVIVGYRNTKFDLNTFTL